MSNLVNVAYNSVSCPFPFLSTDSLYFTTDGLLVYLTGYPISFTAPQKQKNGTNGATSSVLAPNSDARSA